MNEFMEKQLRDNLEIALQYDSLAEYLMGRGLFFIPSNKIDEKPPHAFYNSMLVFNMVNKEQPELELSNKFISELTKKMNDKMLLTEIYGVFKCLLTQTKIEQDGKSTLNITSDDKIKMINRLKQIIEENKELLTSSNYLEGGDYSDGVYGFITSESHKLK